MPHTTLYEVRTSEGEFLAAFAELVHAELWVEGFLWDLKAGLYRVDQPGDVYTIRMLKAQPAESKVRRQRRYGAKSRHS